MDITCPKCKTEYDFDDSKVTEAGVTVKCTSCNYMFKVRRKAIVETEPVAAPIPTLSFPAPLAGLAADNKQWMIRSITGQIFKFKELTTLQQWIVERKVNRDDHISKSGETWKRLGDIAELSSFFQVVDAAMAAEGARPPPGVLPPAQSLLPVQRNTEPEHIGEPAFAAGGAQFQAVGPSAAWEEGGVRVSGRHAAVEMGDEVPRHATGKTVGLVTVGMIVVAGVVLGVVYRDRLKALFSGNEADATYQAGRKLFLLDDEESLRLADQQLAKGSQNDALVQAARAEVYSSWAQHLRDYAELLERRARILEAGSASPTQADEPKRLRLQATNLKNEAERKLGEAESHAKKAVDLGPERGEVKRAMADYLRVHGRNTREVLPFLAAARKTLPEDPETLYVEGAFWGSQGNVTRAEDLLKEALTKTRARYGQSLIRAGFQLAMIHLRAGRRPDARAQAESILAANEKHRWARELLDLVTLEDRQPPVAMRPDSGAATPPPPGDTPKPPTPGDTPKPPTPGGTPKPPTPGGTPTAVAGGSYDQLVKEGNSLSEKGRTMQAFKLFERALKLKPGGLEAHTGIGYCHLDQERFAAAILSFRRALAISPTYGESLIGMAEAYKVQGNNSKALDYYRAYLQANPSGSKATLAKRNVADLERKVGTPSPGPGPGSETPKPEPKPEPAPSPAPDPKAAPTPSSALPDKTGS
jgi:predicted Zn finger-like uncharacterized protein